MERSNSKIKPPPFFHLDDQHDDRDLWTAGIALLAGDSRRRRPKQRHEQMDFAKHVWLQSNADMFQHCCHMTPQLFVKLVSLSAPHLQVDEHQAAESRGATPIEVVVAMGL